MADFTIQVDGQEVPVTKGQTILVASLAAGIDIPTFCWHPKLVPVGSCRICLVEIEKFPKLQVACATVANEGMIVHTKSPKVIKARQGVLEFILAHHPLDCPTCDKGGECSLQDVTFKFGLDYSRLQEPKHRYIVDENSTFDDLRIGPEVIRNQNRCIHCYRCTRLTNEIFFEDDLGVYQRGNHTEILPPPGEQIDNLYSGNVVEYCPVGALTNTDWRYKVRVWLTKTADVVCNHCPDGCNLKLWTFRNKLFRSSCRENDKVDEGFICDIGRYGYQHTVSHDRIKTPMVRKDGELVEVSWSEALDYIRKNTADLKKEMTGSGFFGLIGSGSTNEEIYSFQRFIRRVISTHNIDHRLHRKRKIKPGSEVTNRGIGLDTLEYSDLEKADVVFLVDSDLHSENPITALRIKKAIQNNNCKLLIANSRPTELGVRAAAMEVIFKPGSEALFLLGVTNSLIDSSGLDENEIKEFKNKHSEYDIQKASSISGVSQEDIEQISKYLSDAKNVVFITGQDAVCSSNRDSIYLSLFNLQKLCKSASLITMPLDSNSKGAEIFGAQPDTLPGLSSLSKKNSFEDLWKGPIPEQSGKDILKIFEAIDEDEIECGFIFDSDPSRAFPDGSYVKTILEKLRFLTVVDTFLTDTSRLADCILPLATFAETDGTRVNWEGRLQYSQSALMPLHDSKTGCEIIELLADKLGVSFGQSQPEEVYKEMKESISQDMPERFDDFTQDGVLLRFQQQKELNTLAEIKYIPPLEDEEYPFVLLSGHADHHRNFITEKSNSLKNFCGEPVIGISVAEAEKLDTANGDLVKVESKNGKIVGKIKIIKKFPDGQILLSNSFVEMKPNLLMNRNEPSTLVKLSRM